jgi:integrase
MPRTGTGRIYQRGQKWWIDYSHRGKRYRESAGSTKADATKLLKRRHAEMGQGFVGRDEESVTFEDLAEMIRTDYKVNARKSTKSLEKSLRHLTAAFSGTHAVSITTDRIRLYIAARQDAGAANATVQLELAALRRMFNLAVQAQRLARRPHIPSLRVQNAREGFFAPADFDRLVSELPEPLRPVARFAALTGWRKGEVLSLRWSAVDWHAGVVRLAPGSTKNDEGRSFPFASLPPLLALLEAQRDYTRKVERETGAIVGHVFHRDGQPIRSMRRAWKAACARAGLEGWLFHDLRRTAVRNLERAGVPRSVAMSLTGHKTENVYRRYAIVDHAAQAEGVAKLAILHAGQEAAASKVIPIRGVV